MKSIVCLIWTSYYPALAEAALGQEDKVHIFTSKSLENPLVAAEAAKEMEAANVVLVIKTIDQVWERLEPLILKARAKVPVVSVGYDPSFWSLSSTTIEEAQRAYQYILYGGQDNFRLLLDYLSALAGGDVDKVLEPIPITWEGLWHPDSPVEGFLNLDDYLAWYRDYLKTPLESRPVAGLLLSRHYWINKNLEAEGALIHSLEKRGLAVIPAFSNALKDFSLGNKGAFNWAREVFLDENGRGRVSILIKLLPYFSRASGGNSSQKSLSLKIDSPADDSVAFFRQLNVPVFQPVFSSVKTLAEWEVSLEGLGSEVAWTVCMPEFEGVIEPFFLGGISLNSCGSRPMEVERRQGDLERIAAFSDRLAHWVNLAHKPVADRKVAFILHNDPCASMEATIGGAAKLDSLESVSRIIKALKETGYQVTPVKDGQELIETILARKALAEFRWTTVAEIVGKGGYLDLIELSLYQKWFNDFPPPVKAALIESWGAPPGRAQDGVPAAMVYQDKIVVTGINLGNCLVMAQPKRGCAGARCDGQVCKILHDPAAPPPHQYIASYRWLEEVYGADLVVHVGTHGTLEFLPGKAVGLSKNCYPDLAIHRIPNIYIYNSDNPAEGVIAKRRSYAEIVDHLQTVMARSEADKEFYELESYLGEWSKAVYSSPARARNLERLIVEEIKAKNLTADVRPEEGDFFLVAQRTHEAIGLLSQTAIDEGMHIFGETPQGPKRAEVIYSILRADNGEAEISLRRALAKSLDLDFDSLLKNPGLFIAERGKSNARLLEDIEDQSLTFCLLALSLADKPLERRAKINELFGPQAFQYSDNITNLLGIFDDINSRLDRTDEISSLLKAFDAKYIEPGPSGLITKGQGDIIPTGRNFYSLDPRRLPTLAAYGVGVSLATALVHKFLEEEGRYPENMAMFWMCNDLMWADGEGMSQILALMGVTPVWGPAGRVAGLKLIPLEGLKRPRVDVTIRMSGLLRDSFPEAVNLVDEAVQLVAGLDEPVEDNFVRKHTLERLKDLPNDESAWRKATYRIFSAKPGVYRAGVELAVYASAWRTDQDLTDIFIQWNAYAYGRGDYGQESPHSLAAALSTVDFTYNKVVSDEQDLLGCCGYYGTHGGLSKAASHLKGEKVKDYYGDTREPSSVKVRDLANEIRRVVRAKLLNPKWIEAMKKHGYKGAGDISLRAGRVYGWEATADAVDDWIFDEISRVYVLNDENRHFFEENNPWALEEIERRLLEAHARGLWNPDPKLLEELHSRYLEGEGHLEEGIESFGGEFQGSSIDVFTSQDVPKWRANIKGMKDQ
ncbi:MAG: cobaltochelatase subunit CobN [Deltaproteobacteria bacterium]|jgi:cobaltochelatase CobN|nr:cobaltochelatase subunit CobN [Deltaproteobacteria bacterium]